MEIKWHGHACFEVKGKNVTIVFDPFAGIGLPEPKANADIVLCSHSHRDHNNVEPVKKDDGKVFESFIGSEEHKKVLVKGISTLHDSAGGSQRGKNSIYVVQIDGMKLCHLGDLGHDLADEQLKSIGEVDVVFTPIAGGATIGPDIAWTIVNKLDPKIVIPMHYNLGFAGAPPWFSRAMPIDLEVFLEGKNVERIKQSNFEITKEKLPKELKIMVLTLNL